MLGAIEAGGTKFVCAVSDEQMNIVDTIKFPTATPTETLQKIYAFFVKYPVTAIGVGSFGPIGIDPQNANYGYILNTPKLAWKQFDLLGALKTKLSVPLYWTTDVNIAAYGELMAGAAKLKNKADWLTTFRHASIYLNPFSRVRLILNVELFILFCKNNYPKACYD
ncbi:ROK family protein [Loigolactobacillus coryniformis]|uniref:ROK family protein n=1 Tax=Loigolactobacillus coryniformis TaxID=1610 RepID=UPI0023408355|nr:ROK family protein [Loigolactobacillus coryniformis]MDC4186672.1 ROK family protein [Loigolactobacillus coryniformis]